MRTLTALCLAALAATNAVAANQPAADADKAAIQALEDTYNEGFMAKAPAEVITKARDRLASAEADIDRIQGRLAAFA